MSTAGSLTLNPPQVFDQPWQAQIFALVVGLHERGAFSWPEWSQTLGEVLAESQVSAQVDAQAASLCRGDPDPSWSHWPTALERLLIRRGWAAPGALVALRQAWQLADEMTPHGQPVVLRTGVRRLSGGAGHPDVAASAVVPAPERIRAPGPGPGK